MQPLKLRLSRSLAIALIVVGVLLIVTGVLTERWISLFPGIVMPLVGVLYLVNPALVIDGGEARQQNGFGMALKRLPVRGPTDLRIEGKKLVHVPTGKKLASLGFGMEKGDVAALRAWVEGAPQGMPPQGAPYGQPGTQQGAPYGQPGPQQGAPYGQPGPQQGAAYGQPSPQQGAPYGQPSPQQEAPYWQPGPQQGGPYGQPGQPGQQHGGPAYGASAPPQGYGPTPPGQGAPPQ